MHTTQGAAWTRCLRSMSQDYPHPGVLLCSINETRPAVGDVLSGAVVRSKGLSGTHTAEIADLIH
jgi:hypothetical protein